MELDLGGLETITGPTPEEVLHYLRHMRVDSPFIVLSKDEGSFIQAVYESKNSRYRVEYKQDGRQFVVKTDYEHAASIFLCWMDDSCEIKEQASWKKLTVFNTPFHPITVGLACILASVVIVLTVLDELGLL